LHDYELTVIVSPQVTEENLPAIVDKVSKLITDRGGEIAEVNKWGRRKLAYPINRFEEGNYVLTRFKMGPDKVIEVEKNLLITEEIMRHLVIKVGD
jgi:small subunit ribosomal protein S6